MLKTFAAAAILSIAAVSAASAAVHTGASAPDVAPAAIDQLAGIPKPKLPPRNPMNPRPKPTASGAIDAGPIQLACQVNTPTNPCSLGSSKPKKPVRRPV